MEGNTEENEKEKVGTCPCHTIQKGTVWSEDQWQKHWKDRKVDHKKRIELLHKEARE
jgi:hypothetical protein